MPETPFRMAVSITVAPTSASISWVAPEASIKVILGITVRAFRGKSPAVAAGRASYIGSPRTAPVRRPRAQCAIPSDLRQGSMARLTRRRSAIAARASSVAAASAATAGASSSGGALSTASAARATGHAPTPRADPLIVWASAATHGGSTALMRPTRISTWRSKRASTSWARSWSPKVMRNRCAKSIGSSPAGACRFTAVLRSMIAIPDALRRLSGVSLRQSGEGRVKRGHPKAAKVKACSPGRRVAQHAKALGSEPTDQPVRLDGIADPGFRPAVGDAGFDRLSWNFAAGVVEQRQFSTGLFEAAQEITALGLAWPHGRRIAGFMMAAMAHGWRAQPHVGTRGFLAHAEPRRWSTTINDD